MQERINYSIPLNNVRDSENTYECTLIAHHEAECSRIRRGFVTNCAHSDEVVTEPFFNR